MMARRGVLRAGTAARHRRIDELDAARLHSMAPMRRATDGAMVRKVDVDRARRQAFEELRGQPFDIGAAGDVGADDFARRRQLRPALRTHVAPCASKKSALAAVSHGDSRPSARARPAADGPPSARPWCRSR